nr:nuclear transport factor 2 family protein [Streptomyces sp. CB02959]
MYSSSCMWLLLGGWTAAVSSVAGVRVGHEAHGDDPASVPSGPLHEVGPHAHLDVRTVQEHLVPGAQMFVQQGVPPGDGGRGDGLVALAADFAPQGVEADDHVDARGRGKGRLGITRVSPLDTPAVRTPHEVLTCYYQAMLDKSPDDLADLYSIDAVHEFPFASPGFPPSFEGREAVRAGYRAAWGASPSRWRRSGGARPTRPPIPK